jgi:hypothetical protein
MAHMHRHHLLVPVVFQRQQPGRQLQEPLFQLLEQPSCQGHLVHIQT